MERFAIWFGLLLKKHFLKKTIYVQSIVLMFLLIFIQNIHMPDKENIKIGIYYDDSIYAQWIYDDLVHQNDVYTYLTYNNLNVLEKDVTAGKVECGFIFSEDFDENFEKGSTRKSITYLCTPMSAKGELIKENFFIAFLETYSEIILKESEKELYEVSDKDRQQKILEWNENYLNGDELFELDVRIVKKNGATLVETIKKQTYPVQGLFGILLFLFVYFSYNERKKHNAGDFRSVLNRVEGVGYDILDGLSAGVLPMFCGLMVILFSTCSRGIITEICGALALLVLSVFWIVIFSAVCKKEINYISAMLIVVILQVLICPVFWDLTDYIGSVEYFRYMFPLGFYLSI